MEKEIIYHKDEIRHSTVESIINFLTTNDRSDMLTFGAIVMKLMYKYKEDPNNTNNFYIGSQSLNIIDGHITGNTYTGDEDDLRGYIVDNIPIICVNINGENIVLYDIIEYPGIDEDDYFVSIAYSEYSIKVLEALKNSEQTVQKYNL